MDPFQVALERDVQLILKLMPDKTHDEVRYMLESHQENPSRVQVSTYSQSLSKTTFTDSQNETMFNLGVLK